MKGYALLSDDSSWTPPGKIMVPMGEISYFNTTGTAVDIVTQSDGSTNMVKAAPTSALSAGVMEFDNGGADNGRLRYTGTVTRDFHIAATFTLTPTNNNDSFVAGVAKTGTVVAASKILQKMGTTADTQFGSIHAFVSLATNDYLELFFGNMTGTSDVTIKTMNIFAMGM